MNRVCSSSIRAFTVARPGAPALRPDHVSDVVQMAVKAADQAADHGVGIAQLDHQGGDQGVGAAHD